LGWQGGLSHINNKPIEYVLKVMRENGFHRDAGKSMKLQKSASLSSIKSNINVYISKKTKHYNKFKCIMVQL
jgi:hypothetical protein